jgi:hypothetical protein
MIGRETYIAGDDGIAERWGMKRLEELAAQTLTDMQHVFLLDELAGEVGSHGELRIPFACFLDAAAARYFLSQKYDAAPGKWLLSRMTRDTCALKCNVQDNFERTLNEIKGGYWKIDSSRAEVQ